MSEFENSEVMVKYATLMRGDRIAKEAYTARNVLTILGLETIFPAIGAASAAAAASTAGTSAASGAVLGALGLAGGITTGGLIFAVLGVAGLAYTIYDLITDTDNRISDLLSDIDELDYEGTQAEQVVLDWIIKLEEAQKSVKWPSLAGLTDEEKGIRLGTLLQNVQNLKLLLVDIYKEFKSISGDLGDQQNILFDDRGDFLKSLAENMKYVDAMLAKVKSQAHTAGQTMFRSLEKPTELVIEIGGLDAEITKLWAKPQYTDAEKRALEFGQRAIRGKVTAQEIKTYFGVLVKLKATLETQILPAAKKLNSRLKKASRKIAVTLPQDPTAGVVKSPESAEAPKTPSKVPGRGRSIPQLDTVKEMQGQLNRLAVANDFPVARLTTDGRYGPRTAKTAAEVLWLLESNLDAKQFPVQAQALAKLKHSGLSADMLLNYAEMNKNAAYLNELTNTVDRVFKSHMGAASPTQPMSQRDPTKPPPPQAKVAPVSGCNPNRQNPSDSNMLSCFKRLYSNIGGSRVNLYDYAVQNRGMSDNDILALLRRKYPGWAPKTWAIEGIVEALGNTYSIR